MAAPTARQLGRCLPRRRLRPPGDERGRPRSGRRRPVDPQVPARRKEVTGERSVPRRGSSACSWRAWRGRSPGKRGPAAATSRAAWPGCCCGPRWPAGAGGWRSGRGPRTTRRPASGCWRAFSPSRRSSLSASLGSPIRATTFGEPLAEGLFGPVSALLGPLREMRELKRFVLPAGWAAVVAATLTLEVRLRGPPPGARPRPRRARRGGGPR